MLAKNRLETDEPNLLTKIASERADGGYVYSPILGYELGAANLTNGVCHTLADFCPNPQKDKSDAWLCFESTIFGYVGRR